jgi:4-oxalmesaconate hydratase
VLNVKIDVHGHVTAPDSLYVYKAGLVSHRGAHGRGDAALTAEAANAALDAPSRSSAASLTVSTWTTRTSTTS